MTIANLQHQLQRKAYYNILYLYFTTERNCLNNVDPKKVFCFRLTYDGDVSRVIFSGSYY